MGHSFTEFRDSLDSSKVFNDITDTGWFGDAVYEKFSPAEYDRRYAATRARMEELGVDALIVGGGPNHWTFGGGMLWLTGHWEWHGMACYLLVPREGEPTLVYSMGGTHLEATRREVSIADVRHSRGGHFGAVLAEVAKEKNLDSARIGHPPIDPRHGDYMPVNQLQALKDGLPDAEIVLLDEMFHDLLVTKSEEEMECVRQAGRLCVAALDAMVERARPGVTEWELRAAAASAILAGGGDIDFLILAATSTHDPHAVFGSPRPSGRVLREGDVIVDELAAGYRGYTAQVGMPIFVGDAEPSTAKFYDEVCLPGYLQMRDAIKPGNTLADVHRAGSYFREHGAQSRPILLHGIDLVSSRPHIFIDSFDDEPITPGQVLMLEPNPIRMDGNLGMFLGQTFIIHTDGVENVTEHSLERIVTG
ncbi:MAG: aminopeptidase P family protein [Acidothermales bacterium]|nr:aminopeptidase P family protein [Acidothermales bacterium]